MVSFKASVLVDLSTVQMYQALKLRSDVFVVEQACIYPDLDDKDIHQDAVHVLGFAEENNQLIAYARCLPPGLSYDCSSIGRVVVAPVARGQGLAQKLMEEAILVCRKTWPDKSVEIGAQVYLQSFYEGLGFVPTSEPYDEDGIMHIDMKLKTTN